MTNGFLRAQVEQIGQGQAIGRIEIAGGGRSCRDAAAFRRDSLALAGRAKAPTIVDSIASKHCSTGEPMTDDVKKTRSAAVKRTSKKSAKAASKARNATATNRKAPTADAKPTLLAGGNPQIAKGYGDAPVQAYIAAMPGWKSDVGRRLDALIVDTVPGVSKAVKWNSPFYGVEGEGWFLSIHCFTKYVKVAFFRGTSLRPVPPGESKTKETRYLNLHEGELDEAQFAAWVKQASQLPGERM
jgi:hypothetical protein